MVEYIFLTFIFISGIISLFVSTNKRYYEKVVKEYSEIIAKSNVKKLKIAAIIQLIGVVAIIIFIILRNMQ